MAKVTFNGRYDRNNVDNIDEQTLADLILKEEPMGGAWGDATIRYEDDFGGKRELIVLADKVHGFYLNYIGSDREVYLSLSNRDALHKVICPDDWEASLGLFLDRNSAFSALLDFIRSGCRSDKIDWINEKDMPEGSNW